MLSMSTLNYVMLAVMGLGAVVIVPLILFQRGRGSGLIGTFQGGEGKSLFGPRSGDLFTVITIIAVVAWIALAAIYSTLFSGS